MICCMPMLRKYPENYIFLFVLTSCMGVLVGMTVFAWTTTTDFTGAGPYLFAAMFCLMLFGLVISILGLCGVNIQWAVMFYDFLGVLLFTFYIVFDTQLIIGGDHQLQFGIDDYCFAALTLYLDLINMFLHILALLGKRR